MFRPGRNDPCPCGSGKKYKHCHAKVREESSPGEAAWRRLRRVLDGHPTRMLRFIRQVYGPAALEEGWAEFILWDEDEMPFDPDTPHIQAFMPWFFHAWDPDPAETSIEDETLHHRSPTEVLLERRGRRLDPLLRRYLEACAATPFSFHEIVRCQPGVGFRTRDLFLGEEREVSERSASRTFQAGDAFFGQVVTCEGVTIMEACGPVPIPPERKIPLIELREEMAEGPMPPTLEFLPDWRFELLEAYHDIHDALLHPRMPILQNTDGEDLVFHRLSYEIGSPERALEALAHLDSEQTAGELLESAERDAEGRIERASFAWTVPGNRVNRGVPNTALARIEIEGTRLVAEVNSVERAARFRKLVQEALGEDARFAGAEVETLEDALEREAAEGPPEPNESADLSEHPEVQEMTRKVMAAHYESWVSESVPALGGLTPMEAVQDAVGREKVEALFRQFDRDGRRMGRPMDPEVMARLRERLGLEGPA